MIERVRTSAMIRKVEVAEMLGVSTVTIDRWVRSHQFPPPVFLVPGAPARWRAHEVEDFIRKAKRSRKRRPAQRGMFR